MQSPLAFRPRRAELEWVGGRYRFPAEVRDGDAIIRPEMILWLELPSQLLVGSTLIRPRDPVSAADSLDEAMKRPVDGSPRRPQRIRVADEAMAAELRASLPGTPVVVAAVPELDVVFEQFVAEVEQTTAEPSYLGDGDNIPPDAVRELFQAASLLFRAAPWRHISDQQVLRVDIPHFGIEGACLSVIGAGGDSFGLLLFDSIDDFEAFALAAERGEVPNEEEDDIGPDGLVSLRSLSFDRKKDLPPRMLAEVERHRWPVAGAKAYPVLFCLDGAQTPLPTTEDDVRIMTACTRAFLAFFARHRELFAMDEPEPVTESSSGEDDVKVTLTAPFVIFDDEDDAWEEPPAQRRQQVGRNDPCPCGSGKKYKKCHLDADEEPQRAASRAESVHERDRRLVLAIARFADRTFGPAWAGIDVQADEGLVPLIVPWVAWTAAVDGKRVAEAFLERNAAQLSDDEREWFDAQRRAWLSVFEVVRVERGRVDVRDLLTGEERSLREELGSRSLVVRDVILARIVEFRGTPLLGGMHGRALLPSDAAQVIDAVRAKLRLRKGNVPVERLQNFKIGLFLIDRWTDAVYAVDERRSTPPRLQNTDGDPLLFVTDSFRFDRANRAEIERRLAALEGADLIESTKAESEVVFVRTSDDTVVGRVTVTAGMLRIETNSEKRADALRRRVRDACVGMLRDEQRERREPPSLSAAASAASKSRHVETLEEQAVIREYKEKHYRKWLDMTLPALGGKTPREAARSATSRRDVDLLLRDMENREQRLPEAARFDVRRLRRELGLKE